VLGINSLCENQIHQFFSAGVSISFHLVKKTKTATFAIPFANTGPKGRHFAVIQPKLPTDFCASTPELLSHDDYPDA